MATPWDNLPITLSELEGLWSTLKGVCVELVEQTETRRKWLYKTCNDYVKIPHGYIEAFTLGGKTSLRFDMLDLEGPNALQEISEDDGTVWAIPKDRVYLYFKMIRRVTGELRRHNVIQDEIPTSTEDSAGNEDSMKPEPPPMDAPQGDWFSYYDQLTGGSSEKPSPPPRDAPRDVWFHWFHYVTDKQRYIMSLDDLASKVGLSRSRIGNLHADYMAQYGTKDDMEIVQE